MNWNLALLSLALAAANAGMAQAQDAAAGEKVFAQCRICHQIGPNAKNLVGPELNGVIGSVVHLGYHLGAIRQIHVGARGPRDGDV